MCVKEKDCEYSEQTNSSETGLIDSVEHSLLTLQFSDPGREQRIVREEQYLNMKMNSDPATATHVTSRRLFLAPVRRAKPKGWGKWRNNSVVPIS